MKSFSSFFIFLVFQEQENFSLCMIAQKKWETSLFLLFQSEILSLYYISRNLIIQNNNANFLVNEKLCFFTLAVYKESYIV
jgi:hypothetical protein